MRDEELLKELKMKEAWHRAQVAVDKPCSHIKNYVLQDMERNPDNMFKLGQLAAIMQDAFKRAKEVCPEIED